MLDQLRLVPAQARSLFPRPLANQNRLWREFSNYIRQAAAYWAGAAGTPGSSSALLYYYAFLNLAKAELLTVVPSQIEGAAIHHGLRYNPTRGKSISGDTLTVSNGVFPLLYEHRTGIPLPAGSRLNVGRLLSCVPEIGLELESTGLGLAETLVGYHTIALDDTKAWVLVGTFRTRFLAESSHVTTRRIFRHFDLFSSNENYELRRWRDIFGLSRRLSTSLLVLQSKETFGLRQTDGTTHPDVDAAVNHLRKVLGPYVCDPLDSPADLVFCPSLLKSREVPMPAPLARYALMFYVSSLVRYKPSALDPVRQAKAAWLFDSFATEAPRRLLADAVSGMLRRPVFFETLGYRT
jgi:hypothetical protein